MSRKQFFFTLLVAVISGFVGGMLGVWFLMPQSVLAQDEPQKVIEAERFVLKDAQGRMRAELSINDGNTQGLWFYDIQGSRVAALMGSGILFSNPTDTKDSAGFYRSGAWLTDTNGATLRLTPGLLEMSGGVGDKDSIVILRDDAPRITIIDDEGFQAVLGSTGTVETRTGRTNQTSAASLILFGKDKEVLWSAP